MTGDQLPLDEHGGKVYVGPWGWAEQPPLPLDEEEEER